MVPVDHLYPEFLYPVPLIQADEDVPPYPDLRVMVYRQAINPDDRRPSINDNGRYRYEFSGIRAT